MELCSSTLRGQKWCSKLSNSHALFYWLKQKQVVLVLDTWSVLIPLRCLVFALNLNRSLTSQLDICLVLWTRSFINSTYRRDIRRSTTLDTIRERKSLRRLGVYDQWLVWVSFKGNREPLISLSLNLVFPFACIAPGPGVGGVKDKNFKTKSHRKLSDFSF